MPPPAAGVSAEAHWGSSMWCLMVASLLLTLPHTGGSLAPPEVRAVLGDDVTLPCLVRPPADAGGETEVEWSRSEPDPHWVHVRRSAVEVDQNPAYRNRTWLSAEALKRGDASLRLSKVRLADEGRYTCLLPGLEAQSSIQLVVEAAIEVSRGSAGVLHCESEGWFPQPEVRWLDGAGKLLPAGPTETLRGPGDLYAVSSRLTVEEGHGRTFTCRVQTKPDQFREAGVLVPDDFFAPSSTGRTAMWASLGVILILALVLVGLKRREDKINTKNPPEDEEAPEFQDRWIRSTREDPEQQCLLGAGTDLMMEEKRISKEVQHKVELEEDDLNQDGPEQKKAEEGAQQDNTVEPLLEARQKTEGTGDLDHPGPTASSHRPTDQGQEQGQQNKDQGDQENQDKRDKETQEQSSLENQDHTEQENQDHKDQEKRKQRDQESQDHTQQENQDHKDQEKRKQRDQESQDHTQQENQNQRQQDHQDQRDQENQHQKDQDSHDQRDQEKQDHRDQEGQERENQENQEEQMNEQDQTQTAGQAKRRRKRNRGGKNKKS